LTQLPFGSVHEQIGAEVFYTTYTPLAAIISRAAWTVFFWKLATRLYFSCIARPLNNRGFWAVTPVGNLLVLHRKAWIHLSDNMKARAELHKSAPNASILITDIAAITFPLEISFIFLASHNRLTSADEFKRRFQGHSYRVREFEWHRAWSAR
jgi:hypothetical protein